jgi:4-methyl-5(b-hydroxyethyl)-thiazole monophosphate biosynthesis
VKVLVPIADGVEEMEAVIIIDTLRRAGWEVAVVGLSEGAVRASRGVRLLPDALLDEVDASAYQMIVLPGGNGGTERLSTDERILQVLRDFNNDPAKVVAAICAGPLVLQAAGILRECLVTCHPGARPSLTSGRYIDSAVVVDGRLVTSQGPGTSFAFALKLIELVEGVEKADALAEAMVVSTTRSE